MKTKRKIVLAFLAVAAIASLSGCRAFAKWHSRLKGDIGQEYLIQDARNRIANYEWYYDQYHAIKAAAQKARIAAGRPEEAGIKMVLAGMVEEYNSKSRMETTRELWKARDLPYQISFEEAMK